jgi:hypothetical protein
MRLLSDILQRGKENGSGRGELSLDMAHAHPHSIKATPLQFQPTSTYFNLLQLISTKFNQNEKNGSDH